MIFFVKSTTSRAWALLGSWARITNGEIVQKVLFFGQFPFGGVWGL